MQKNIFFLCLLSLPSLCFGFESFKSESAIASTNIGCIKPKVNPGDVTFSPLYSCIGGKAETVKLFINGISGSPDVRNVKFLWNDWTKDIGYGVHADAALAKAWVASVATRYAPLDVQKVIDTFFGSKNTVIESDKYRLKYTYTVGPAIDERMYVIERK